MDNFTIAVTIGSRDIKVTSDGTEEGTLFEGALDDIKIATASAKRKDPVSFGEFGESPIADAGFESPISLTAALYSIYPERVRLTKAPKEVYEFLNLVSENNPEVNDITAITNNEVKSGVLKKAASLNKTINQRYYGRKIKVFQQETGIYGEVAISALISLVCILSLFILIKYMYDYEEISILVNLIAIVCTPLAIYCATISVGKLFKNNDISNISYTFVVLFVVFLPFLFLFMPDVGFVTQLFDIDSFQKYISDPAVGDGDPETPW